MTDQPDREDRLEALVSRVLRDLPQPRAPASLERRVHDALAHHGALHRWQRGFSHWSLPTRAAFVVVSLTAMVSLLWLGAGLVIGLPAFASPFLTALGGIVDFAALLGAAVPTTWLYVALGAGSLLYAALFGLGATAYRTLYQQSSNRR